MTDVYGTSGNDRFILNKLFGTNYFGLNGDDQFDSQRGSFYIDGGPGQDELAIDAESALIRADRGYALKGELGAQYLGGAERGRDTFVSIEEFQTTNGDDVAIGSDFGEIFNLNHGNDFLKANGGDDIAAGGRGDDTLLGGDGNDTLDGEGGTDLIYGGNGNDVLDGGVGTVADEADRVYGDAGDDIVSGHAGDDILFGGADNDIVNGGTGNDRLYAGSGNDTVNGDEGNDRLYGGSGFNNLNGGADHDYILGGSDGDTINGGTGNDRIFGGDGHDTISGGGGGDRISLGAGFDLVQMTGQQNGDVLQIADFDAAFDVLDLEGAGIPSFAAAQSTMYDKPNGDLQMNLSDFNLGVVVLAGITSADITDASLGY